MLQLCLLCLLIHWSLLLAIPVMSFCPPRCKCNEVKLLVLCNSTQIDLVPIMLNPKLKELYLGGNRVKNVYSSFTMYHELKYLDLSYNLITDLGKRSFIMQKKLRVLLLNGNNITQISNLSFHGLNTMHLLNLRQNQLAELHSRAFMGLNRLETLDLSFNQISFISKEAFFGLLNLKQLNLQANKLKQVPNHSFFHLQSLAKLNMAANLFSHLAELAFSPLTWLQELWLDSNHISQVSVRAFVHLQNLTYLDLQNNKLFNVPTESLAQLSNLQVLILSRNLISALRHDAFHGLSQLRTLIISSTPLNYVDRDAFRDNVHLTRLVMENNRQLGAISVGTLASQFHSLLYLSLRANRISSLEFGTLNLDRVEYVDLQENPLVCNCSLGWLTDYLRSSNQSKSLKEQVKCFRPAVHSGKTLITLSRSDLSCPKLDATMERTLNVVTGVVLALLIILLLLVCRRFRPKKCLGRTASTSRAHTEHIIASNPAKSRLDHSLYYPAIINEDFTRDKHYHTMTTSTRTSALSVDLHPPPLQYVPIAHI